MVIPAAAGTLKETPKGSRLGISVGSQQLRQDKRG
jgi:hypothetical protein